MPCTAVRVRGLCAGGCRVVVGHLAAASARRGRREHLLLAVQLWRNSATLHMYQCCLAACIGACSHDKPADRAARESARIAGRVQSQAQRQWWQLWTASIWHAVAGFDASATFGTDIRVRHVENLVLEMFNLVCDASTADLKRPSQIKRNANGGNCGQPAFGMLLQGSTHRLHLELTYVFGTWRISCSRCSIWCAIRQQRI